MTAVDMTSAYSHGNIDDAEYSAFLNRVKSRFTTNLSDGKNPAFTTDAAGLWDAYLGTFSDPADRQHHNCNTCRHFIERFGGLVTINEHGESEPAIWNADDAPEHYKPAITAMARLVRRANVTGVFLSSDAHLGQPKTGIWSHLAVTLPASTLHRDRLLTAGQKMAEKREDFGTVVRALAEFTADHIETALRLLKTDTLYQSEKVLGQAEWLGALHTKRSSAADQRRKNNHVWAAVAMAPAGFCHPRSGMIGTLLEDIAAGMEFDQVSKRFADKMHPLRYQRPQAAPTAGNIAQAEKVFEQLGLAPALHRRIARFEEVPKVWEPRARPANPPAGGIFGHLEPKGSGSSSVSMSMPTITMTLQKFVQTVVNDADKLEIMLPAGSAPFIVITTAVYADAPPVFQWDHAFAWYMWHGGAAPSQYGLAGGWAEVAGITRLPARWNDDGQRFKHQGDGLILLLQGARETRQAGAALFPSLLRSELHGVRATIEAHSRSAQLEGMADGTAIGYDLRDGQGSGYPTTVRVTTSGRMQTYKIDRWD